MMLISCYRGLACAGFLETAQNLTRAVRLRVAAFFREEGTALAYLDRRTLADIGIGPDVAWSVAVDLGIDRLRRSPLV